MKNRKIVEFVLYPRLFHSLSILYKGTYCISFKLYHVSPSNTITHGFPFLLPQPKQQSSKDRYHEQACLHTESNFSFQTQSFYMVYEQDCKRLKTECIFRLQYEDGKYYNTYLSCKLLKKQKSEKKPQTNLCTRSVSDSKYQTVQTQIIKINQVQRLNHHHKVIFHCSEFFSAVDLRICSFYQGIKLFQGKKQLSTILEGYDLVKCNPASILKTRKQKKQAQEEKPVQHSFREFKDLTHEITFTYGELLNMLAEYEHWHNATIQFRQQFLSEYDLEGRRLAPFKLGKLTYLNRGHFIKEAEVRRAYGIERQDEVLAAIFQEKQLVRCNIRALREYFCILLFHQPEKKFKEQIIHNMESDELTREQNYVSFQPTMSEIVGGQLRTRASQDFNNLVTFSPEKIERIPYLLVEGYQKPQPLKKKLITLQTLTVFVHGYQGNSFDFQKSKNYLKKYNKNTTILIAESITPEMDKSIEELGKKVAEEVIKHVDQSVFRYDRINFVGFSLGGLLVRSCLSDLGELKDRLGIFVTFSSPHLGISQSQNSLVNLGVWYLIKVDKVKNLKELNFQSVKMHDSLLMKMSMCPHIANFSRVILVSSRDDGFVPLYSTFLERTLCQNQVLSLCNNLRSNIRRLERVQVLFNTDHAGTLDKLTGRRGHIQFLDNHYFLQQFFRLYGPYF